MMLLCMTVTDINSRKALLPWKIIESHSETDTIREFFNSVLVPMLAGPSTAMEVPTVRVSIYIMKYHVEVVLSM